MNFIKTYWPGLMLVIIAIFIGVSTYQDYGMGMDEYDQRNMGLAYYNYVFNNDTSFHHYIERDHGSGFELPLVILEKKNTIN